MRHWRGWSWGLVVASLLAWPGVGLSAELLRATVQRPGLPTVVADTEFWADLSQAQVVYLGETHGSEADHQLQLAIATQLQQQNPKIAIALEMFQQPFQPVIDQYLAGEIDEDTLRQQTEYDQRWGFPWESYAPILRLARDRNLPVIALNLPSEVSRQVAAKGLQSLRPDQRQWIPPLDEIHLDDTDPINQAYRQLLLTFYKDFHSGHGSARGFEQFFTAQVLWDETMAAGIADFVRHNPDHQVVVLTGQGHVAYGYGIPSRVARRIDTPDFQQRLVLLNPNTEFLGEDAVQESAIADYTLHTRPSTEP